MPVLTKEFYLETEGETHIINITDYVQRIIKDCGLKDGIVCLFVPGSTGALTTIEYEPGLLKDLPRALEKIAPREAYYEHEKMWHDGNGHSHVRASIIGPCLTIPFVNGNLTLGTWQQIVFLELDVRARRRRIIVQIVGD
ncbi:MAG: secondary thiamine-phosphate synthase enzyme YjbQ [Nitrososphaerales archaeon]